jgi:hypothetical protein
MTERFGHRVLIVGCGAIGGVMAGHLLEVGYDVTLLTTNTEIARALREQGIRVRGEAVPQSVPFSKLSMGAFCRSTTSCSRRSRRRSRPRRRALVPGSRTTAAWFVFRMASAKSVSLRSSEKIA